MLDFKFISKKKIHLVSTKPLIFFHIPKSAGLSLLNAFTFLPQKIIPGWCHPYHKVIKDNKIFKMHQNQKKKSYETTNIKYNHYAAEQNFKFNKEIYENAKFIAGHLPAHLLSRKIHQLFSFCLVRDPIKRAISNYYFWHKRGYLPRSKSLKYLYESKILQSNLTLNFFSKNSDFVEALEVLQSLDIVTDADNIEALIQYIISIYNFPNIVFTSVNRNNYYKNINKKDYDIFLKFNEKDIEFYEEAKKHFFNFSNFKKNENSSDKKYFLSILSSQTGNAHKNVKMLFKNKDQVLRWIKKNY